MQEAQPIGKLLETEGLTAPKLKRRYEEWDWVELTEEETDDALGYRKMLKGGAMQEADKRENERIKRLKFQEPWTYDQLKEAVLTEAKNLPFEFVIDEFNEEVFHLLLLYFTNDPEFNDEEIEYKDGKKVKLSLNKGIALISSKKGTGKSILMHLFQGNKRMPFLCVPTKNISSMYKDKGDSVIREHSELLHVAPMPCFSYHQRIGICFEDLGNEMPKANWGDKSDVMADILFRIYETNQHTGNFFPYHITSNLSGNDFENRYGDRIRDRMRECWNVIVVKGESRRK